MTTPSDDRFNRHDIDFGEDAGAPLPDDPQFDAWLAQHAPSINAPNATPREDIWAAIQRAQHTHAAAASGAIPGVRPLHRRWQLPAIIAATLLLGIAIDRVVTRDDASTRVAATTPADSATRREIGDSNVQAPAAIATIPRSVESDSSAPSGGSSVETVQGLRAAPSHRLAEASPNRSPNRDALAPLPAGARASDPVSSDVSRLYRLAAVQTLTQAEALLTAYRATDSVTRTAPAARQLGQWGREVLSSTRLLIDSPAGRDPHLRPLLNDLELVLVQIVRLSGAPLDAGDRALIDRAMRDSDLLPRIRIAVPAGTVSSTTD